MIKKRILFFITLIILVSSKVSALDDVYVVFKIDDEIITNIDIKKEAKFLIALNETLKTLPEKQLVNLSKKSIIKETIKKNELIKFFELNQEDPYLNTFMENLHIKLNLTNLNELEIFLNTYNLTIKEVKKKN